VLDALGNAHLWAAVTPSALSTRLP